MAMVDKLFGLSHNDATACSSDESDVGRSGNRERSVAVCSGGKGQICQREEHTALHRSAGIQVFRPDADLRPRIAFCYFNYLDAVLPCKLIVQEECFQCLNSVIIHILLYLFMAVSCATLLFLLVRQGRIQKKIPSLTTKNLNLKNLIP